MWIIERYLRYGIIFLILWAILFLWTHYGCSNVQTSQMEPYLVRDGFVFVRSGAIYPDDIDVQKDVLQFENAGVRSAKVTRLVGRVIGKPGDRVWIDKGKVYRAKRGSSRGEPLAEQYLKPELMSPVTEEYEEVVIPRDCYWLMGDNRKKEPDKDSRKFGPIQVHAVDGAVGKTPF
jgi:signal peptidase I